MRPCRCTFKNYSERSVEKLLCCTGDCLHVCRPGQDWHQDGHPTHWTTTGKYLTELCIPQGIQVPLPRFLCTLMIEYHDKNLDIASSSEADHHP